GAGVGIALRSSLTSAMLLRGGAGVVEPRRRAPEDGGALSDFSLNRSPTPWRGGSEGFDGVTGAAAKPYEEPLDGSAGDSRRSSASAVWNSLGSASVSSVLSGSTVSYDPVVKTGTSSGSGSETRGGSGAFGLLFGIVWAPASGRGTGARA